jgi:hypothetical protein
LSGVSRLNSHNLWPERHYLMLFSRIAFSNTYVSWNELNAHPTWLMLSHVRQNVCDFHYLRENIYIFSTCFNRSDRCIYWPEQGNCLPTCIFRAFSILLHVHCAPFLSFSTIYHPRSRQLWSTDLLWGKLKIEDKVVHIAQRNQKRGVKKKSVNREKHEKDKMTEVKISLTDGPSCWIHLVKPWICGLSSILHCRKNGSSE